jgi:hypothetical protein
MYLRDAFKGHFKDKADIKFIDPSYLIRCGGGGPSQPASHAHGLLCCCLHLARPALAAAHPRPALAAAHPRPAPSRPPAAPSPPRPTTVSTARWGVVLGGEAAAAVPGPPRLIVP